MLYYGIIKMNNKKRKQIAESLFKTLDDTPEEDRETYLQLLSKELDEIIVMCKRWLDFGSSPE